MATFAPYLVRLRTRSVGLLRGALQDGTSSPAPAGLPDWSPSLDTSAGIVGLEAANIGTANNGPPGDVLVAGSAALPEMSDGENQDVLADRGQAAAFVHVDGMAVGAHRRQDP